VINLNRFDLASLRLYVAVVDAGSLTAGADRFGISLAAASKRMAELEHHCGMALLQRSQRGVTATPGGRTLHRHAIELVARLEQLALAIDDIHTGTLGHLRLWANPSAFGSFLPELVAAYAQRHPEVKLDLEDALSEDSVRALHTGTAELAVIGENTPCEGLETFVCDVDELVLVLPADHALAGSTRVAFADVLDHDFVTLARYASLTRKISAAAEAAGRSLRIRVQVRSFDAICRMVATGLGLTVLPRASAPLYARALGLQIAAIDGLDMRRRLLMAMRSRTALSAAAQALVEMAEQRVAALAAQPAAPAITDVWAPVEPTQATPN
jgi:DNA-binding transcriptional LysR family regulator